jgi:hypothetical protein
MPGDERSCMRASETGLRVRASGYSEVGAGDDGELFSAAVRDDGCADAADRTTVQRLSPCARLLPDRALAKFTHYAPADVVQADPAPSRSLGVVAIRGPDAGQDLDDPLDVELLVEDALLLGFEVAGGERRDGVLQELHDDPRSDGDHTRAGVGIGRRDVDDVLPEGARRDLPREKGLRQWDALLRAPAAEDLERRHDVGKRDVAAQDREAGEEACGGPEAHFLQEGRGGRGVARDVDAISLHQALDDRIEAPPQDLDELRHELGVELDLDA